MVRTSQCFRTKYSQLDGPRTLAAAEAIPCTLALPASLIEPDYGVYALDLSRRHRLYSRASSLRSACMKACQFICLALRFRRFRRQCTTLLRSLQGKLLFEATRESKFRPHTQGTKSAAGSVTAS
jgi:hypothetical protein